MAAWRLVKQRDSSVGQSLSDLRYGAGEGTFGEIRGCDAAATEHWQRPANVLRLDQQPRPTCQGLGTLGILARGTANSKSLLLRCHGLPWPFRSAVLPHIRLPFRPDSPPTSSRVEVCLRFPPASLPPLYASISGLRSHAVIPIYDRHLLCAPVTPTVRSCLLFAALCGPRRCHVVPPTTRAGTPLDRLALLSPPPPSLVKQVRHIPPPSGQASTSVPATLARGDPTHTPQKLPGVRLEWTTILPSLGSWCRPVLLIKKNDAREAAGQTSHH